MNKRLQKFIRKYNGWLGFVLASVLFFVAPHIYRTFDPTAGQYDAGYIHPIIYAMVVICAASGAAWTLLALTAPGPHKQLDEFFESGMSDDYSFGHKKLATLSALGLYVFFFIMFVTLVVCIV